MDGDSTLLCACLCVCAQCGPQAGFIVQPSMNGLLWESRTYFNRGRPLPLTLLNSAVRSKTVTAMASIDLRGQEPPAHREYALSEPQRTDFAQHILQQCEGYCKLVSNSGILRVDLGEEYLHCDDAAELSNRAERLVAEAQLRSEQPRPHLWNCTGHGFIVRFFLNEVTSTLDVNCTILSVALSRLHSQSSHLPHLVFVILFVLCVSGFSQQTNFPIVYEAAYATAQQIIRVAKNAKKGKQLEEETGLMEDVATAEPQPLALPAEPTPTPASPVIADAASASSSKRKQAFEHGEEEKKQGSVAKRTKAEMMHEPSAAANGAAPATANSNGSGAAALPPRASAVCSPEWPQPAADTAARTD